LKKSSQLMGIQLIGMKEGAECGVIQDIVIDQQTKKVRSVILRSAKNEYEFLELQIGDVLGIGKDYVTTKSNDAVKKVDLKNGMTIMSVKCIDSSGDVLGDIEEIAFEEKTGEIVSVKTDSGMEIDGSNIISLSNGRMFVGLEGSTAADQQKNESFEEEQREFMLGRTVNADITNEAGEVIIEKGTTVTEETIRLAEEAGVTVDLTLCLD